MSQCRRDPDPLDPQPLRGLLFALALSLPCWAALATLVVWLT